MKPLQKHIVMRHVVGALGSCFLLAHEKQWPLGNRSDLNFTFRLACEFVPGQEYYLKRFFKEILPPICHRETSVCQMVLRILDETCLCKEDVIASSRLFMTGTVYKDTMFLHRMVTDGTRFVNLEKITTDQFYVASVISGSITLIVIAAIIAIDVTD